ncbi:6-hydroxy-D-nicotine oxidase [Apiospora saccharicola]
METDPKIGLFVSFNPTFVAVGLLYANSPAEIPAVFKPFLDLKSLVNAVVPWTEGTVKSLVESIQFNAPSARRTQSMTTTKVSLDLYIESHELYLEAIKTSAAELFYTIQPVACSVMQEGEDRGGNIMGIEKVAQDCAFQFSPSLTPVAHYCSPYRSYFELTRPCGDIGWVAAGSRQDAALDEEAIRDVDNLCFATVISLVSNPTTKMLRLPLAV